MIGWDWDRVGTVRKRFTNMKKSIYTCVKMEKAYLESMCKRRTATTGHLFKSLLGHGNGLGGWKQDISHFTLEGNETNLITTLVGFGE